MYQPSDVDSLAQTLQALAMADFPCEALLSEGVREGEECSGVVTLDGDVIECDGADGYSLVDATTLKLNGAACQALIADPVQLTATFPCDALVQP